MNPATAKARELLGKLERLCDRANGGTDAERAQARRKLERLKSRFDFTAPAPPETGDIFAGQKFKRSAGRSAQVHSFQPSEWDIASSVKWAIEKATGIPCVFRGGDLLAEATPATANRLAKVALHISQNFQTLLDRLGGLSGVTASDRTIFVRGLYDGMMNDGRAVGERLPGRLAQRKKRSKPKKGAVAPPPGLSVHPYYVALPLGRQIRFAAPLEEIAAELERATRPAIPDAAS